MGLLRPMAFYPVTYFCGSLHSVFVSKFKLPSTLLSATVASIWASTQSPAAAASMPDMEV